MNQDTMISDLEANGRVEIPISMYLDARELDKRVKYGDESGWRGDPTMCICFNQITHRFEIWGIDRGGNEYMAASDDTLSTNLIVKLREGDPHRGDVFQRVLDHNAKLKADAEAKDREAFAELGDKMQWAIRRDVHNGRGAFTALPDKVGG